VSKADGQSTPVVSGSQVFAAGLASTMAAFVTSKFGVAGTILGAALTTMIITGGAAILNAYLQSVAGSVRKVPHKLQARRERRKAQRYAEPPTQTLPGRPDLRDNFMGRARAALGWFSHLPLPARRSILVKGLIAAAVAFVISMGTIYALERGIGNNLSCGLWGKCPEGATPGIHRLGGGDGTGAGSTIGGGRVSQSTGLDRDGGIIGSDQQQQRRPLWQRNSVEQQEDRGFQLPAQRQREDRGFQLPAQRQQENGGFQLPAQQQQEDRGFQPPAQRQQDSVEPEAAPVDPNNREVMPVEPEASSEPGQPVPGQPTPQQQQGASE
jgi:hypothetical protein